MRGADAYAEYVQTLIQDWGDLIEELSKAKMVSLYNGLADKPLVKFQSKENGASRLFPLIERQASSFVGLMPPAADEKKPAPKATTSKKRSSRSDRGIITIDPQEKANPCRSGTKQQQLIVALVGGATVKQLMYATSSKFGGKSWTETSVKSGLYHDVYIKGYGVRTEAVVEGDPSSYIYHLVFPEGQTEVLPVKVSGKKAAA